MYASIKINHKVMLDDGTRTGYNQRSRASPGAASYTYIGSDRTKAAEVDGTVSRQAAAFGNGAIAVP